MSYMAIQKGAYGEGRKAGLASRAKEVGELRKALHNAQSLLHAFGGDLTKYPRAAADAGQIDAVMYECQMQVKRALAPRTAKRTVEPE